MTPAFLSGWGLEAHACTHFSQLVTLAALLIGLLRHQRCPGDHLAHTLKVYMRYQLLPSCAQPSAQLQLALLHTALWFVELATSCVVTIVYCHLFDKVVYVMVELMQHFFVGMCAVNAFMMYFEVRHAVKLQVAHNVALCTQNIMSQSHAQIHTTAHMQSVLEPHVIQVCEACLPCPCGCTLRTACCLTAALPDSRPDCCCLLASCVDSPRMSL